MSAIVGAQNFPIYQMYDKSIAVLPLISDFASRLIGTPAQLTENQIDSIQQLIVQNGTNPEATRVVPTAVNWEAVISGAQNFITADQLAALNASIDQHIAHHEMYVITVNAKK